MSIHNFMSGIGIFLLCLHAVLMIHLWVWRKVVFTWKVIYTFILLVPFSGAFIYLASLRPEPPFGEE